MPISLQGGDDPRGIIPRRTHPVRSRLAIVEAMRDTIARGATFDVRVRGRGTGLPGACHSAPSALPRGPDVEPSVPPPGQPPAHREAGRLLGGSLRRSFTLLGVVRRT